MTDRINGVLEDISAEIGYTATTKLVVWYGNRHFLVPVKAAPDHLMARILGDRPFSRLCEAFGGEVLYIPNAERIDTMRHEVAVARMVEQGHGVRDIAQTLTVSERYVNQIRRRLEESGVLPLVLKAKTNVEAL